ncbi:MAG TPA: NifU family protein [Candidatus Sulfomarinibacteraceae bacterium]|nr:NifU family protein [Candidatus Sulfomarinibacteraceae bacterium]
MNSLYGRSSPEFNGISPDANDDERMSLLIDTLGAYIEYFHGGGLELVDFDGRTLRVRMTGACRGCSLAPATLHGWIEGTVRPFFPKLEKVIAVA